MFLRAAGEGLSSRDGKSYVFTKAHVTKIKKAYPKWVAERTAARAVKVAANETVTPERDDAS